MNRQPKLNDSFEENERLANQQIIAFSDDRVPSSLQGKKTDSEYKKQAFVDFEIDERPTRERPGKENKRNVINIDENEDTFHNEEQFEKIFARGEKLKRQMD